MPTPKLELEKAAGVIGGLLEGKTMEDVSCDVGVGIGTVHKVKKHMIGKDPAGYLRDMIRAEPGVSIDEQFAIVQADNSKLRREVNKLLNYQEILARSVRESVPYLPACKPRSTPNRKKSSGKPVENAVLCLSDVHLGAKVTRAETMGLGLYNWDICKARIDAVVHRVRMLIDLHRSYARIERLDIEMLGDMLDGTAIFKGHWREIDADQRKQYHGGVRYFSSLCRDLAADFDEVHVHAVRGNHGRGFGAPGENLFSFDQAVYDQMAHELFNVPNVTMEFSDPLEDNDEVSEYMSEGDGLLYTDGVGHRHLLMHGHQFKGYASIAAYGFFRHKSNLSESLEEYPAFISCGHHHQYAELSRAHWTGFMCGAMVGASSFSVNRLGKASRPEQLLYATTDGLRAPAWTRRIMLGDVKALAP